MTDKILFDNYNGRECYLYVLHGDGIEVGITDFGAAVQFIRLKTEAGIKEVALGFPTIEERVKSGTYCGATIGRVANRISGAKFTLNGKEYFLCANEGKNVNHGGTEGFDKRFFNARITGGAVEFSLESPDGDMGFPAKLDFKVRYELKGKDLCVRYSAVSDNDTLWCPTCHAYFNLDGAGDARGNLIKINAQNYTPVGKGLIPTGEILPVAGTPFDFTDYKPMGRDVDADDGQLKLGGGYDHNFILNGEHAASVIGGASGIKLDIFTDMPCLQFYSGNYLDGYAVNGKLFPRCAFALEPQEAPNAINTRGFNAPVLRGGKERSYYVRYSFGF